MLLLPYTACRDTEGSERPGEEEKSVFVLDLVRRVAPVAPSAPVLKKEGAVRLLRYYLSLVNQHRAASTRFKAVLSALCCPYLRK